MGQIVQFCQDKKIMFHQNISSVTGTCPEAAMAARDSRSSSSSLAWKIREKCLRTWSKTYVSLHHNVGEIILKLMMKTCWYHDIQQDIILVKGIQKI